MKKILIILLLSYYGNILFAQNIIKGIIINSKTNEVVELASISIKNKNIGVYSNLDGRFLIENINEEDTIVVSHMSFQEYLIPVSKYSSSRNIYLTPKTIELEEVCCTKFSQKEYKLFPKKRLLMNSSEQGISGHELTTLIKNTALENAYIKEFVFLTKEIVVDNFFVKIHFYKNNNGKPGEKIIIKDNLFKLEKASTKTVLNIYDSNVIFPKEGLFCALEFIGVKIDRNFSRMEGVLANMRPRILMMEKKDCKESFVRNWTNEWVNHNSLVESGMGFRFSFGLTLLK